MPARLIVAKVQAELGAEDHRVEIAAGRHALVGDEGPGLGGKDAGPSPYQFLLSGLAACTAITLRMYAQRKAWKLTGLHVDLRFTRDGETSRIDRTLTVTGDLDDQQRARLADIAERTPVTLTLKSGVEIRTELR